LGWDGLVGWAGVVLWGCGGCCRGYQIMFEIGLLRHIWPGCLIACPRVCMLGWKPPRPLGQMGVGLMLVV
jgi:hypothetical protein